MTVCRDEYCESRGRLSGIEGTMKHGIPKNTVLLLALYSEGALLLLTGIVALPFGLHAGVSPSWRLAGLGALATLPIFLFNFGLFALLAHRSARFLHFKAFKEGLVDPICANLDVPSAFAIAVGSGVIEELFFRGALEPAIASWAGGEIAVLLSAALFSYAHFVGSLRRFAKMAVIYFLFGLYFSLLVHTTGSLFPAMVAHSLYNFGVIVYVRYWEMPNA